MSVRAKFKVMSITDNGNGVARTVKLYCVYDTTIPEDQRFFDSTPSGNVEMTINNPAALAQFTIGKAFYADFTEVPAA